MNKKVLIQNIAGVTIVLSLGWLIDIWLMTLLKPIYCKVCLSLFGIGLSIYLVVDALMPDEYKK